MYQYVSCFFAVDQLSLLMLFLSIFIGVCVGGFAFRYMKGDVNYGVFFTRLVLLVGSLSVLFIADHFLFIFLGWSFSNFILFRMMRHKSSWKAAEKSSLMAAKNYLIGSCCIGVAFILLYFSSGTASVKELVKHLPYDFLSLTALCLLLIGAMTQSAIMPFHRWLISSLNSPTPVSAIMHAGLINGGGFLLVRFAPLYLEQPYLLDVIFVLGMVTSFIGTFWKLMQSDVKKMLACSTMGQMGFMLAQCGLGLFPAAIVHLFTHGMFKAYLFLSSGSAAQDKRFELKDSPKPFAFLCCIFCGLIGSCAFILTSGKSWLPADSTFVLVFISFITSCQVALPVLYVKSSFRLPLAIGITGIVSATYGLSISWMTGFLKPMGLMQPQALNGLHIVAIILMALSWLIALFFKDFQKKSFLKPWLMKGYVAGLNESQPHPDTTTTFRKQYKYL